MSELDKFKRRLIRSVARLMLQEKRSEEEVWTEMKKETGCDCKVLWQRMRILTMKKLTRLLAADDRADSIPAIAQMTLTDWLIFDLVIVHEKFDIIGEDRITAKNPDSKALTALFTLVQRFNIEGRVGESLAEAWTAATVLYNTQGHQCSPMLMQRRWYQLKELTRARFYKFWFTYRGNARKLSEAEEYTPSRLQRAIAQKFPAIITSSFLDWEELIKMKLVIMPEKFDEKMRMKILPKPCNENSPELVILEPIIETIDLGHDSDSDCQESKGCEDPVENTLTDEIQIKNEPDDMDADDNDAEVNVISEGITKPQLALESVEQEELLFENDNIDDDVEDIVTEENHVINAVKSYETQGLQGVSEDNTETDVAAPGFDTHIPDGSQEVIPKITSVFGNIDITNETLSQISSLTQAQMVPETQYTTKPTDNETNLLATVDLEDIEMEEIKKEIEPEMINDIEEFNADVINDSTATELEQAIAVRAESYISKLKTKNKDQGLSGDYYPMDSDFDSNGIEFVDDGIEYVDEDELVKNNTNGNPSFVAIKSEGGGVNESENSSVDNDGTPKFDLKLLMYPVVYTTKLDDMSVFKGVMSIDSVSDKNLIESITVESKPTSAKGVVVTDIKQEKENMILEDDRGINDDLFIPTAASDESEEEIDDSKRVKLSNYLLQKPRSRSYNPIQLCKNPDFNTRLKRLPVSFFSSSRNRFLLKACKPMTIDVTKAFESKLIDRTLYLKATDKPVVMIDDDNNTNNTVSVLPSAMAVQSLIDNTKLKDVLTSPPHRHKAPYPDRNHSPPDDGLERNKVINLPDIMQVRRINQRLLTAEVPPIRVKNTNTIDIEEVSTLRTVNNNADTRNIDLTRQSVSNYPAVNRENTPQSLAYDKNTSLAIPIETAPTYDINPDVNKEQVFNIEGGNSHENEPYVVTEPVKELSSRAPSPNTVAYLNAHETRTNDFRKYKPLWRPLANDKTKLSWVTKPKNINASKVDESLLTIDTLNKMLVLISGSNEQQNIKKKKKKVAKNAESLGGNKSIPESEKQNNRNDEDKKNETTTITTRKQTSKKPKITISHGNKANPGYKGKYCCWARYRLFSKESKALKHACVHACPSNNCMCCCKEALIQSTAIVLSDDEDVQLKNACDSIESVVQQTRDIVSDKDRGSVRIVNKPSAVVRKLSNRQAIRRSIGTDPMEPSSCDEMQVSNEISETTKTISSDRPLTSHTRRENINMVDVTVESQDIIHPQAMSETPASNVIEQSSVPTTPFPSPIDSAAKTLSSPVVTETLINQPDPNIKDSPHISTRPISNVCINSTKRHLVIDGSKSLRIEQNFPTNENSCNAQNKVLYLNKKYISKKPSSSPIYLGKNKILLTNVKFPREIQSCPLPVAPKPTIAANLMPTLQIPNGVQLVLLSNGQLTFTVDPGARIDPLELSVLPEIMAAVQQQLTFSSILNTPDAPTLGTVDMCATGLVNHSHDEVHDNTVTVALSNSTKISTNEEKNTEMQVQSDGALNSVNTKEIATNVTSNTIENITTGSQNTEEIVQQNLSQQQISDTNNTKIHKENDETATTNFNAVSDNNIKEYTIDNDNAILDSNRKSLLSDLMELSGISAEDTTPSLFPEIAPQGSDIPVPLPDLVPLKINKITSANVAISLHADNELQVSKLPIPGLIPIDKNIAQINQSPHIPDLSPVTSFAELKYACDHNGLFFKLDYDTGVIMPINVCIKKNPKNLKHNIDNIVPKAVIDLTDDVDFASKVEISQKKLPIILNKKITRADTGVKPVKVYKALHSRSLLRKDIMATHKDSTTDKGRLDKKILNNARRKQRLNKIEANIDLIDSDDPMEEEYLIDTSSDDSGAHRNDSQNLNDSDDEPLINIAKRKRNIEENTQEKELNENTQATENVEQNKIPVEFHTTASAFVKSDEVNMDETAWSELVDSPMEGPAKLLYVNNDSEEEDCILGV